MKAQLYFSQSKSLQFISKGLGSRESVRKRQTGVPTVGQSILSDLVKPNAEVLNSWKEVALYLGRGVRTVQRWEQELALPVRRPRGKARSAVMALKPELDRWLVRTTKESILTAKSSMLLAASQPVVHHHQTHALAEKTRQLLARSLELCERSRYLSEEINRAVALACRLTRGPNDNKLAEVETSPPPRWQSERSIV